MNKIIFIYKRSMAFRIFLCSPPGRVGLASTRPTSVWEALAWRTSHFTPRRIQYWSICHRYVLNASLDFETGRILVLGFAAGRRGGFAERRGCGKGTLGLGTHGDPEKRFVALRVAVGCGGDHDQYVGGSWRAAGARVLGRRGRGRRALFVQEVPGRPTVNRLPELSGAGHRV